MMEKDENSSTSYYMHRYVSDTFFIFSISMIANSFYILKRFTVSVNVIICPRIVESWRMRFMRQLRQETRGVSAQTITVSQNTFGTSDKELSHKQIISASAFLAATNRYIAAPYLSC